MRVTVLAAVLLMVTAVACDDDELPALVATAPATVGTPIANACGPNPSPYRPVQPTEFSYRQIDMPQPNSSVQSPMTISGEANPFEGAFSVSLFATGGQQLYSSGDYFHKSNVELGFAVSVSFSVTAPTPACIWYHERSGRDGSPINITQVPVLLQP